MAKVRQINVKDERPGEHGLPKHPVPQARVGERGVEGDFNRYRQETLHGEAESAVLILPSEILEALRTEGWPVRPGDLGENFLTEGVPNASLGPGARVRLGEVVVRVTRACDPCTNLYSLPYVGSARGPQFLKVMMGRRGWYARVERPGSVSVGDPVVLVPAP